MKSKEELKQHKEHYIHIPKRSCICSMLFLLSLILSIGGIFVIIDSWTFLGLGDLECSETDCNYNLHHLLLLPLFLLEYLLISLSICLFASIFKKLKSYKEDGLIFGLIAGLIFGLIFGLILGLIVGLIVGLIFGLIVGLIFGLIFGLIVEFEE